MLQLTGTHIAYLHTCHRKLWLFAHGIQMEHTSETVYEGKLIGETSYPQRAAKYTEIEVPGAKIDFYDPEKKVVHEVKKSNRIEKAHISQALYYMYKLKKEGIANISAVLEYPKLKKRKEIPSSALDENERTKWEEETALIIQRETPPPVINSPICRSCSYCDLCYVE